MRHWTFWEWVAYGALFIAALIIAADASLKSAPDVMAWLPDFVHSMWWGFAPAVLVVASTIILLLREFVFSNEKPLAVTHVPAPIERPTAPKSEERVFVGDNITPKYLVNFFDEHTGIQATQMTKPFIGKWMRLSGRLREVLASTPEYGAQLSFQKGDEEGFLSCYMHFDPLWFDRLSILRRDDQLTVIGQIRAIEPLVLNLDHCELVD